MRRVSIVPTTEPGRLAVRIAESNGQLASTFSPFENANPHIAVLVAHDRALVIGTHGRAALYDCASLECLRRANLGAEKTWARHHVSRDGATLILYDERRFIAIRTDTLAVETSGDCIKRRSTGNDFDIIDRQGSACEPGEWRLAFSNRVGLFEAPVGTVLVPFFDPIGTKDAPRYQDCLLALDLGRRTATKSVIETTHTDVFGNPLQWFSPSGRYAVRHHFGAIPKHDGHTPITYSDAFYRATGKGATRTLPDCQPDGISRLGVALEVWKLPSATPVAKIPVRMWSVGQLGKHTKDLRDLAAALDFAATKPGEPFGLQMNMRVGYIVRAWWHPHQRRIADVLWEPDETAFWIFIQPNELRRVALDGSLSPIFQLGDPRDIRLNPWRERFERAAMYAPPSILSWADDGRLRVDMMTERLVDLKASERPANGGSLDHLTETLPGVSLDRPVPPSMLEGVRTIIALPDLYEHSIIAAIEALRDRVATQLDQMRDSREGYIRSAFLTPSRLLDERQFFIHVGDSCPAAVPALRALITTFGNRPRKVRWAQNDYYTDEEVAFGYAALALATLDPLSHEALSAFLISRDAEHDHFTRDQIFQTFADRHGWQGEAGLRFGIECAHCETFSGGQDLNHVWAYQGLREAVHRQVSPSDFARLLFAASANKYAIEKIAGGWVRALESKTKLTRPFDREIADAILDAYYGQNGSDCIPIIRRALALSIARRDEGGHYATYLHIVERAERAMLVDAFAQMMIAVVAENTSKRAALVPQALKAIGELPGIDTPYGRAAFDALTEWTNGIAEPVSDRTS